MSIVKYVLQQSVCVYRCSGGESVVSRSGWCCVNALRIEYKYVCLIYTVMASLNVMWDATICK